MINYSDILLNETEVTNDLFCKVLIEKLVNLYDEIDNSYWGANVKFNYNPILRRRYLNAHYNAKNSVMDIFDLAHELGIDVQELQSVVRQNYTEYISGCWLEERYNKHGVALKTDFADRFFPVYLR